jgi:putative membrane protein
MKTFNKITLLKAGFSLGVLIGLTSCGNSPEAINANDKRNEVAVDSTNKAKDTKFIVSVAEIDMEEISLGKLAQQNSSMTDVKEMGKMMEDDHRNSLNTLTALAGKESIIIPSALNDNAQADEKKLNAVSGADFDKEYCDMMVSGHKDAITMFEKASTETKDSNIKQFAVATLPALHSHLNHAMTCQQECKKM